MICTKVKCSKKYVNSVRQQVLNSSSFFRFSWSEEKEMSSCSPQINDEGEKVKYLIFIINKETVYLILKFVHVIL